LIISEGFTNFYIMNDIDMKKAVAIKYIEDLPAPFICAKGKGDIAKVMIKIAKENGIELVNNPELTDSFLELDVSAFIPEEYYEIIAQLLIFVRKLKNTL
jgi:flagellar biosynthesis protein